MPKEKKAIGYGIYVGNMPAELNQEDVESLFEKYNVKVCDLHRSGQKIFCFMKLARVSDITRAVREMNRKDINGRKLVVREFEDKRGTLKLDRRLCKDSDCHNLSTEDTVPPPLETPSVRQNTSFNDNISFEKFETSSEFQSRHHGHLKLPTSGHHDAFDHLSSQVQNSYHNYSNSFVQADERGHPSGMESSVHMPKRRITHSNPKHVETKTTRNQNRSPRMSADPNQSLNKSSEKFYVHCTRNVISYNPRDLQTSETNSCNSPSETVSVQVANFPFGTSKTQILKLFEDFSPINVYIDNNKPGSSYTQATVTLPSLDAAEAAIMELDNTMYKRRAIIVTLADDEFAEGYDEEEEYDEGDDGYYYESESQYSEQESCCRPNREQYMDRQLSRRFNDIHIS